MYEQKTAVEEEQPTEPTPIVKRDKRGRIMSDKFVQNHQKGIKSPNPSGNPYGDKAASWAATIKKMGNMTAGELAKYVGATSELGQMFAKMPKGKPMKELVVARIMAQLMFDPTPGLWNGMVEREDGRVPLAMDITHLQIDASEAERRIFELMERAKARGALQAGEIVNGEVTSEIKKDEEK